MKEISPVLRVDTEVVSLLRAIEKYFGGNAEYEKGKGMSFMHYMQTFHPKAYLYPIVRACGGSRHDVGTKGAIPALVNTPYYLEFLIWRLNTGADGILETNLSTLLEFTEVQRFVNNLYYCCSSDQMAWWKNSGKKDDLLQ